MTWKSTNAGRTDIRPHWEVTLPIIVLRPQYQDNEYDLCIKIKDILLLLLYYYMRQDYTLRKASHKILDNLEIWQSSKNYVKQIKER